MQFFRAIKLVLTLKCHESTQLVSASLERQLSFAECWAVRLHAVGCWSCRRFRRQIEFIRAAMRRSETWDVGEVPGPHHELGEEARERIRNQLRRNGFDPK